MPPRLDQLPVIVQNGNFRLQLSNMKITDALLPSVLARAEAQLMAAAANQGMTSVTEFRHVPLVEVTLNRNRLTDASMQHIATFVLSNPKITSIEILGNQLTDASADVVRRLMVESQLQRIKVGDNAITHVGAGVLAEGLQRCHRDFLQLHVGGNPLGDEGVMRICNACRGSHVEVLGLRDVGLAGTDAWLAIAALSEGSCVNELHLKGNEITLESASALAEMCRASPGVGGASSTGSGKSAGLPGGGVAHGNSRLKTLLLASCRITGPILQAMVPFFAKHTQLTSLDLSNNDIGDAGVMAMLPWLEDATQLRTLALQRCHLTRDGLAALANGSGDFYTPPTRGRTRSCALSSLTELDLSQNDFTVEGTTLMARLVDLCPALERLSIHRCLIGGPELSVLCKVIASHASLRDIDASSNFSGEYGSSWELALTRNPQLERVVLTDNAMPANITGSIIHCLVNNPRPNIKTLQIGGQSQTEPVANVVLPAAHCALSQLLATNRHDSRNGVDSRSATGSLTTTTATTAAATALSSTTAASHVVPDVRDIRQQLGYPTVLPSPSSNSGGGGMLALGSTSALTMPTAGPHGQPLPGSLHHHHQQHHLQHHHQHPMFGLPQLFPGGPPPPPSPFHVPSPGGAAAAATLGGSGNVFAPQPAAPPPPPPSNGYSPVPPGATVVWYPVVQQTGPAMSLSMDGSIW